MVAKGLTQFGVLALTGLTACLHEWGSLSIQRTYAQQQEDLLLPVEERIRSILTRSEEDENAIRVVFTMDDRAVSALVKLLRTSDTTIRSNAARALAYIGDPGGLNALRNVVKAERDKEVRSKISYFLAGALVQSRERSDVDFLKRLVNRARRAKDIDDDQDAFAAVSAALALGMMGTPDALATLRGIANHDIVDAEEIGKAIRWIEKKRNIGSLPTLSGSSEEEVITRIVLHQTFFAERGQDNTSVNKVTLSQNLRKALISLEVKGPQYARGYDIVLSKASGVWEVAGVWFTWVT